MNSRWKKLFWYAIYVSIVGCLAYGLWKILLAGYSVTWTGFGDFTKPNGEFVRGKTLWDWMQLFLVPLTLSVGVFFLNRAERETERQRAEDRTKLEREIATDRQQEAALQTYFDRMSDLLLKEKLRTTGVEEVRDVARTRTISIMRVLDTKRNNLVIQFLREAKLITDEKSILNSANMEGMNLQELDLEKVYMQHAELDVAILKSANLNRANLTGANLQNAFMAYAKLGSANLQGAILSGANLQGAFLSEANLQGAKLGDVELQGATLHRANLQDTSLRYANLQGADLGSANFQRANLSDASLQDANLEGANLLSAKNITEEQLAEAKSLKGAIMPDGTKHE